MKKVLRVFMLLFAFLVIWGGQGLLSDYYYGVWQWVELYGGGY